jgi:predicted small lipoprotein YifL
MRRVLLAGCLLALLLAACGGPKTLPDDEAQAFAEQVAPLTENLLAALSNGDEAAYTREMDATMKGASSGDKFTQVYDTVIGKIGKYVSSAMTQVLEQGNYRIVIYDARFENEEHVTVRVVYDVSGAQPLVAGLWFDSPRLRGQ